jgi:hypothetical protein
MVTFAILKDVDITCHGTKVLPTSYYGSYQVQWSFYKKKYLPFFNKHATFIIKQSRLHHPQAVEIKMKADHQSKRSHPHNLQI